MASLPPCGLYRTSVAIGDIPAERLVYFHNHGDPGPGLYLPAEWNANRARFREEGMVLPDPALADSLVPLAREGLYRVKVSFVCCAERCMEYAPNQLVQLGYNGKAEAILFLPAWTEAGLAIPSMGNRVDRDRLAKLERLVVREESAHATEERGALH